MSTGETILPLLQRRVYDLLNGNVGALVEYSAFESICSYRMGSGGGLAEVVRRLRRRGVRIENIYGQGYRIPKPKRKRRPTMTRVELTEHDEVFASDIQDALVGVMTHHANTVSFESQIAILGVALGALLSQLTHDDRELLTAVFVQNMKSASELSEIMQVQ